MWELFTFEVQFVVCFCFQFLLLEVDIYEAADLE